MANFDPEAIEQHNVTARDIENARRYVALLQGTGSKTYADIAAGCYYGTSALLHEVIELRVLLKLDRWLLFRSRQRAKRFLRDNEDAHVEALKVEYPYLQRKIAEELGEKVELGDLTIANTRRLDYERLVESDLQLPIFPPTRLGTRRAVALLDRLKECDCSRREA